MSMEARRKRKSLKSIDSTNYDVISYLIKRLMHVFYMSPASVAVACEASSIPYTFSLESINARLSMDITEMLETEHAQLHIELDGYPEDSPARVTAKLVLECPRTRLGEELRKIINILCRLVDTAEAFQKLRDLLRD